MGLMARFIRGSAVDGGEPLDARAMLGVAVRDRHLAVGEQVRGSAQRLRQARPKAASAGVDVQQEERACRLVCRIMPQTLEGDERLVRIRRDHYRAACVAVASRQTPDGQLWTAQQHEAIAMAAYYADAGPDHGQWLDRAAKFAQMALQQEGTRAPGASPNTSTTTSTPDPHVGKVMINTPYGQEWLPPDAAERLLGDATIQRLWKHEAAELQNPGSTPTDDDDEDDDEGPSQEPGDAQADDPSAPPRSPVGVPQSARGGPWVPGRALPAVPSAPAPEPPAPPSDPAWWSSAEAIPLIARFRQRHGHDQALPPTLDLLIVSLQYDAPLMRNATVVTPDIQRGIDDMLARVARERGRAGGGGSR